MPRGDKSAYTDKQKRQARHIEKSLEADGSSTKRAARIAWATVNKQDGGGKKSGSARTSKSPKSSGSAKSSTKPTAKSSTKTSTKNSAKISAKTASRKSTPKAKSKSK